MKSIWIFLKYNTLTVLYDFLRKQSYMLMLEYSQPSNPSKMTRSSDAYLYNYFLESLLIFFFFRNYTRKPC